MRLRSTPSSSNKGEVDVESRTFSWQTSWSERSTALRCVVLTFALFVVCYIGSSYYGLSMGLSAPYRAKQPIPMSSLIDWSQVVPASKFVHSANDGVKIDKCFELVWRDPRTQNQIRLPEVDSDPPEVICYKTLVNNPMYNSTYTPLPHIPNLQKTVSPCFQYRNGTHKCLPAFLILGFSKCGTSSLAKYLGSHPQIEAPDRKELFYFSDIPNWRSGILWYLSYLREPQPGQLVFEASARYTFTFPKETAQRVKKVIPKAKFIVLLREPVSRAFSRWWMFKRTNFTDLSFETITRQELDFMYKCQKTPPKDMIVTRRPDTYPKELLKPHKWHAGCSLVYMREVFMPTLPDFIPDNPKSRYPYGNVISGIYADFIEVWLDEFPREQFMFIDNHELLENPRKVLRELEDFLGIEHFEYAERDLNALYNTAIWRGWDVATEKPTNLTKLPTDFVLQERVSQELLEELSKLYRPHTRRLEKLLNMNFSHWDKSWQELSADVNRNMDAE